MVKIKKNHLNKKNFQVDKTLKYFYWLSHNIAAKHDIDLDSMNKIFITLHRDLNVFYYVNDKKNKNEDKTEKKSEKIDNFVKFLQSVNISD